MFLLFADRLRAKHPTVTLHFLKTFRSHIVFNMTRDTNCWHSCLKLLLSLSLLYWSMQKRNVNVFFHIPLVMNKNSIFELVSCLFGCMFYLSFCLSLVYHMHTHKHVSNHVHTDRHTCTTKIFYLPDIVGHKWQFKEHCLYFCNFNADHFKILF